MAKTPEGIVQEYGRKQLTAKGCLVRKISYEGRRGCPDQLVLVPTTMKPIETPFGYNRVMHLPSRVIFIEYKKADDIEPEEHQLKEHERMRRRGADVRIICSKAEVDALIEELFPCAI